MSRIMAAATLGSNTAHMLVAATDGELVTRMDNLTEWIPLGEVVGRVGLIPNDRVEELVHACREFRRIAQVRRVEGLYVFATEAIRSARNHNAVLQHIANETGVKVEVVKPEREAELGVYGSLLDCGDPRPDLVFEVGGGSTQIAWVGTEKLEKHVSVPLGTGKIIAEAGIKFPCHPESLRKAQVFIDHCLSGIEVEIGRQFRTVASGGIIRGLWRALHPDAEKRMFRPELEYISWVAGRLTPDRIVARFGVKQKRATTLLPGALVYRALMLKFGVTEMIVSEYGVREGAILEMARGNIEVCPVAAA